MQDSCVEKRVDKLGKIKVTEKGLKIGEFFAAEYRRMMNYVRGIIEDSSDWDSEDIIQDVMEGIFKVPDITRPVEDLSAYVYRSLRNRVIDRMRRHRATLSLDAEDPETGGALVDILEDARSDTESVLFMEELTAALLDSIDNLPEEQRSIVIMTEFDGITFREISEKTGIPAGTLLSRKSRAIDRLRSELSHYRNFMEK